MKGREGGRGRQTGETKVKRTSLKGYTTVGERDVHKLRRWRNEAKKVGVGGG